MSKVKCASCAKKQEEIDVLYEKLARVTTERDVMEYGFSSVRNSLSQTNQKLRAAQAENVKLLLKNTELEARPTTRIEKHEYVERVNVLKVGVFAAFFVGIISGVALLILACLFLK